MTKWTWAACTVAVATAVGGAAMAASADIENETVQAIERYCQTSWSNAGIDRQEWEDCTQQTLVELAASISPGRFQVAIYCRNTEERRELNRTIWRITQRYRRTPWVASFQDGSHVPDSDCDQECWEEVVAAADCLTSQQRQILSLYRDGWKISEIAELLDLTPPQVSHKKNSALNKLRRYFDE